MSFVIDYCDEILIPLPYLHMALDLKPCWCKMLYEGCIKEGYIGNGDIEILPSSHIHHTTLDNEVKMDFPDDDELKIVCVKDSGVRNILKLHAYLLTDRLFVKPLRLLR